MDARFYSFENEEIEFFYLEIKFANEALYKMWRKKCRERNYYLQTAIMIRFKRIDHIQICIPLGAESEARGFYTGVIGLTEIRKPDALVANGGLWYEIADVQLHIGTENEINKSKRHPAFEVEDLDVARQHLKNFGVSIREETQIPGHIRFSFMDPFKNRIELLQKI